MHPLQNGSQVQNMPPLKPLVGTAGYFSESNEQGAPSWPGQDYFNKQIAEFLNALAAADIAYDHARTDHLARMISGSNFAWLSMPIGHPFSLELHIQGVEPPPVDNSRFRYVKLSSNDPYNAGILINEMVTGSAPVLSVTAEINFPQSPMHGHRIELRNTSKLFSRAGENGGIVVGDTSRKITGSFSAANSTSVGQSHIGAFGGSESFSYPVPATGGPSVSLVRNVTFDSSRVTPTSDQNQPVHLQEPFFLRIF
ncbi:TPA: hypothetical protein I6182_001539 [Vibrio cholerae]|nr:hypothetical protein [Vibrio cholerae]HAS3588040.1 hypothetical protein [Vibrio cholerae]